MDFNKAQHLFQMLAGAFLGGKTYSEHCAFLSEALEEAIYGIDPKTHKIRKGIKTLLSLTKENHQRAEKHLNMIEDFLKKQTSTHGMAISEVDNIEEIVHEMLQLSPSSQNRVKGLIQKLKNEPQEIKFREDLKAEYEQSITNTQESQTS